MTGLLRREVLIPLLVVLLGGGAYVTKPWSSDAPAPARQQAPATGAAAQGATGPVADVRLDLLTATGGDAATIMRNPFRFQPRAVPAATTVRRAAPRPEFTAPPVPTGPPPPPPITLRFIGLIEASRTGRVALLLEPGETPSVPVERRHDVVPAVAVDIVDVNLTAAGALRASPTAKRHGVIRPESLCRTACRLLPPTSGLQNVGTSVTVHVTDAARMAVAMPRVGHLV